MKKSIILVVLAFIVLASVVFMLATDAFQKNSSLRSKVEERSVPTTEKVGQKTLENTMTLSSPIFVHNGGLPILATCAGRGVNPPLEISGAPKNAKSLALIFEDPDAPNGTFIHWVLWNIDPQTRIVKEDSVPDGAIQGMNSDHRVSYVAACPPSGTHRYVFNLYALDEVLDLPQSTTALDLEHAMEGHVLDSTHIAALYR